MQPSSAGESAWCGRQGCDVRSPAVLVCGERVGAPSSAGASGPDSALGLDQGSQLADVDDSKLRRTQLVAFVEVDECAEAPAAVAFAVVENLRDDP